jgi:hypothetical protein
LVGGEVGPARPAIGRHIQAGNVVVNRLEQGAGLRSVEIVDTALAIRSDHYGEPIRLRIGRAAQQNRVQDAENCRIHADAEGQGADHDQGESRALAKLPEGGAGVGPGCHASLFARAMPGCILRNVFGTHGLARQQPPVVFACGIRATVDVQIFSQKLKP